MNINLLDELIADYYGFEKPVGISDRNYFVGNGSRAFSQI
jgi:hypothetical protein